MHIQNLNESLLYTLLYSLKNVILILLTLAVNLK
jgi:hypothetical protein